MEKTTKETDMFKALGIPSRIKTIHRKALEIRIITDIEDYTDLSLNDYYMLKNITSEILDSIQFRIKELSA